MPKKANKKSSKKDDSEDEYEPVDEGELLDEDLEEFDEDMDEEEDDSDEEKDIIEPDVDNNECMIDEAIEDDNEYFENNEETEVPAENSAEFVSKENRVSCNRLT